MMCLWKTWVCVNLWPIERLRLECASKRDFRVHGFCAAGTWTTWPRDKFPAYKEHIYVPSKEIILMYVIRFPCALYHIIWHFSDILITFTKLQYVILSYCCYFVLAIWNSSNKLKYLTKTNNVQCLRYNQVKHPKSSKTKNLFPLLTITL